MRKKSNRISLINSSWPELLKINTSANASVFIFHNSGHSEFIYHMLRAGVLALPKHAVLFSSQNH